ncbi:MAG: GDP-mannose 4,6-dehydratase [Rhodomicrobiaceae bacterium]
MKYLITGGCGFLGTNIAKEILERKNHLVILDNLSRNGSTQNLKWLKPHGNFEFVHGDIRNSNDVENIISIHQPDVIYHLAGQVAMTTSIANPRLDFEVNAVGSFNLLNAVRLYSPNSAVIYSSTNKVYGDLETFRYRETSTRYECIDQPNGFDEKCTLDFHSPYGTSKGSADQYMLDFSRIYGLKTAVFRHSSIYGGRQYSSYDQGWVGWFIQKALEIQNNSSIEPFTISGNGKQVRDLLFASDCVALYLKAAEQIEELKGQVYNIGGGINNSSSLLELFVLLEEILNITMNFRKLPPRESDQRVYIADISKIYKQIGWSPKIDKKDGIKKMIQWIKNS